MIQMILGGLGAVSLFVAALSIANTMTMAIYERTKEIGVMKVLGCGLGKIRAMFLVEAAMIGFLGGVFGVAISYALSLLLNTFGPVSYTHLQPRTIAVKRICDVGNWLRGFDSILAENLLRECKVFFCGCAFGFRQYLIFGNSFFNQISFHGDCFGNAFSGSLAARHDDQSIGIGQMVFICGVQAPGEEPGHTLSAKPGTKNNDGLRCV